MNPGAIASRNKLKMRQKRHTESFLQEKDNQYGTAQKFLNVINDSLSKCVGIGDYYDDDDEDKFDVSILFQTYDDNSVAIGYWDSEKYLLDSDFIYKRFCYLCSEEKRILSAQELYAWLFEIGLLQPYDEAERLRQKPLRGIKFSEGYRAYSYKECFCIPMNIV
jgi:hypothetical protein